MLDVKLKNNNNNNGTTKAGNVLISISFQKRASGRGNKRRLVLPPPLRFWPLRLRPPEGEGVEVPGEGRSSAPGSIPQLRV